MYAFFIKHQSTRIYLIGFGSSMSVFFDNYIKGTGGEVVKRTENSIIIKTNAGVLSSIITVIGVFLDNTSGLYIPISEETLDKLINKK